MFLNFDVAPWFRNIGKRLVKSPKGYLLDSLLLCHMLDLNLEDLQVKRPELFGHLRVNFVATELMKLLSFSEKKAGLYHFCTSDGKEVDFMLEKPDGSLIAIEVKKQKRYLSGISKDFRPLPDSMKKTLWAVPFYVLWQ
ncbi:DUF4143 domain-containing protein [Flavihumibacter stibioxidans]|uniref:DUF4143 domain-containing protein n=1 Tax=Flavihumibacter stibioxidans TaxID=1834163 RepID=A0ABR7MDJ7_9BACT|nr:DUF4143 domain-containing protein [Flavihumibacter stibioxidans]MBC6493031.1 hypothetical protein [Flavihumibacter stibioxidans]